MNRDELKEYLKYYDYPSGSKLPPNANKHLSILEPLKYNTKFLDIVYDNVKVATRCFCIVYDIYEIPKCGYCLGPTNIGPSKNIKKLYTKSGFTQFCSRSCVTKGTYELKKQNNLEKYGVEHHMNRDVIKDKVKATTLKNNGVECIFTSNGFQDNYKREYFAKTGYTHHFANPEVIKKREEHNKEKYGFTNPSQNPDVKEKIANTITERYGVNSVLRLDHFREKGKATSLEKYGYKHATQSPEIKAAIKNRSLEKFGVENHSQLHFSKEFIELINNPEELKKEYNELGSSHALAKRYNIGCHRTVLLNLHKHGIELNDPSKVSSIELEVHRFLTDNGINFRASDRGILSPKELDIVIDDHNIAIEINGDYYHSDIFKPKTYHQDKSISCKEKGYKLIHVYEYMLNDKVYKEVMFNKILFMCGKLRSKRVFARKTNVIELKNKDVKEFYSNNHIQGHKTSKIVYGLVYKDELIACISFDEIKEGIFDLTRYASSKQVIGGFSKLLKYFKRNNNWSTIQTFSSLDYSHGDLYFNSGFNLEYITNPNYFYVKSGRRFSRQQLMKHKLKDRLEFYDSKLTEKELTDLNGYLRIYDSGSMKFSINNNK